MPLTKRKTVALTRIMALLFSAIALTQLANMGRARARLNRRYLFLLVVGLIFAIVVSLVVMAKFGFEEQSVPIDSSPAFTGNPLQRPLEYPATALAVDDGKVFVAVSNNWVGGGYPSIINCFDGQNGRSLWNNSDYGGSLVVSGGRVYFGVTLRKVSCLDATSGALLWTVENEQGMGEAYSRPNVAVKDGRLYTYTDHLIVLNATTGELLWQATYRNITDLKNWQVDGFALNGDPYEGKFVYGTGGDYSSMHYFKLNTVNGDVLWRSSVTWESNPQFWYLLPQVLAITDTQVVIFKSGIFSLDSNTGNKLWSSPIDTNIYSPTVYNNLLLFSGSDGYFYALYLTDGTVAWKTKVDTQNLFSLKSTPFGVSPIVQMDFENQRLFWSFGAKTDASPANYTGTLCCLDLSNGNINWNKQTGGPWFAPNAGIVVNNGKVFLTGNNALWIYNASTGDLVESQQFDGSALAPVVLGNTTFVAAGLKLFAYV